MLHLPPSLAHLTTLEGPKGRRLIVSGWWGLVRHPNYLGELLVQVLKHTGWTVPLVGHYSWKIKLYLYLYFAHFTLL